MPAPSISDDDRRIIGLWAAECAARVLHPFEARARWDRRPREAIAAIRAFARGKTPKAPLRAIAMAAHAAARDVDDPVATAAARAAGFAAATAFIHGPNTLGTAGHIHGAAAYAARARGLVDPRLRDQQIRWAVDRASPAVRAIVRRVPPLRPARGWFGALLYELDAALRRPAIRRDTPSRARRRSRRPSP